MKNKKLFAILTLLCFMMTLMPVAAFAAAFDYQESYVYTTDSSASEKVVTDAKDANLGVKFDFGGATTDSIYVWFVKSGSNVPVLAVDAPADQNGNTVTVDKSTGIINITGTVVEGKEYLFAFANSGTYSVYAAINNPQDVTDESTLAGQISKVEGKLSNISGQTSFEITSSSSSSNYAMKLTAGDILNAIKGDAPYAANGKESPDSKTTAEAVNATAKLDENGNYVFANSEDSNYYADGVQFDVSGLDANNVVGGEYTAKFVDAKGKVVRGQSVTFETNSSNLTVNKEKATTDTLGQVKFKLSASAEGTYKVYITAGSYEATLNVTVGATGAYDITVAKAPTAPVDVNTEFSAKNDKIQFTFADANGNAVKTAKAKAAGAVAAFDQTGSATVNGKATNTRPYVAIVSQPSASKLENKDLYLVESDNEYKANLCIDTNDELAEGSYTVKVVLDNGKYVTVTFEVKEFATPVALNLAYKADSVELNSYVDIDTLEWVDANGVTKDCDNKVDLAANGYAVDRFYSADETVNGVKIPAGRVYAKSDDKYVGSTITVVAVDDRYNLTAQATLTVADEATALAFDTKTLAVNVNNKVGVSVVDSNGNKVALNRADADKSISYVVLDKPEGAKVSVTTDNADNKLLEEGTFVMNVTSNTVGNVTIQAVAKVTYKDEATQQTVVKYYTGTQIFAVGNSSVGQVVVMSIGSNEIVINDAKSSIDAAPMIQNDRTYVPFRALAEAFGATVAYDEATQAVTAELNGVTVVMTIGSATYTVNGAEKTMDVAPFISGSRTMIPVRFAAEAFGIKVIPTYDQNGATADILFNL